MLAYEYIVNPKTANVHPTTILHTHHIITTCKATCEHLGLNLIAEFLPYHGHVRQASTALSNMQAV